MIAIIGILAAFALPQYTQYRAHALNVKAESNLHDLISFEEAYYATHSQYVALSTQGAAGPVSIPVGSDAFRVASQVVLDAQLAIVNGKDSYIGSAYNVQGNASYTVTGSVAIIRKH